jgi:hypothetical protein
VIIVSNASPLIILAKISYFNLPQRLFNEITISEDVWDEVVIKGAGFPGSAETRAGRPVRVESYSTVSEFSADVHLAKPVFSWCWGAYKRYLPNDSTRTNGKRCGFSSGREESSTN